jgi:hypothetical protein
VILTKSHSPPSLPLPPFTKLRGSYNENIFKKEVKSVRLHMEMINVKAVAKNTGSGAQKSEEA